jgi:hypothetical protein
MEADARGSSWDTKDPIVASVQRAREARPEHSAEPRETVDPFDEPFDEEEIVLDNFATWDSAQYRRSVRVENRRDRGFTTMVQQALDASAAEASDLQPGWKPQAQVTSSPQERPADEADAQRPRVRLAVVSEPAPLRPIPVVKTPALSGNQNTATVDPAFADLDVPVVDPLTAAYESAVEEDILVVEDDPDDLTHLENFGQSDRFRRLLARLRGND